MRSFHEERDAFLRITIRLFIKDQCHQGETILWSNVLTVLFSMDTGVDDAMLAYLLWVMDDAELSM